MSWHKIIDHIDHVVRYLLESNYQSFAAKNVGVVLIASPSYGSRTADRLRWLAGRIVPRRNSLHEFVVLLGVEYENPHATELGVGSSPRNGHVQQLLLAGRIRLAA